MHNIPRFGMSVFVFGPEKYGGPHANNTHSAKYSNALTTPPAAKATEGCGRFFNNCGSTFNGLLEKTDLREPSPVLIELDEIKPLGSATPLAKLPASPNRIANDTFRE